MAYSNYTHFYEQLSYNILCNLSYQLKDMDLDIICKKENKTEKKGFGIELRSAGLAREELATRPGLDL